MFEQDIFLTYLKKMCCLKQNIILNVESLKAPNPAKKGGILADYNQLDSFSKRLVHQITYQMIHEARFSAFSRD